MPSSVSPRSAVAGPPNVASGGGVAMVLQSGPAVCPRAGPVSTVANTSNQATLIDLFITNLGLELVIAQRDVASLELIEVPHVLSFQPNAGQARSVAQLRQVDPGAGSVRHPQSSLP